jgi:hypothetical protein
MQTVPGAQPFLASTRHSEVIVQSMWKLFPWSLIDKDTIPLDIGDEILGHIMAIWLINER